MRGSFGGRPPATYGIPAGSPSALELVSHGRVASIPRGGCTEVPRGTPAQSALARGENHLAKSRAVQVLLRGWRSGLSDLAEFRLAGARSRPLGPCQRNCGSDAIEYQDSIRLGACRATWFGHPARGSGHATRVTRASIRPAACCIRIPPGRPCPVEQLRPCRPFRRYSPSTNQCDPRALNEIRTPRSIPDVSRARIGVIAASAEGSAPKFSTGCSQVAR